MAKVLSDHLTNPNPWLFLDAWLTLPHLQQTSGPQLSALLGAFKVILTLTRIQCNYESESINNHLGRIICAVVHLYKNVNLRMVENLRNLALSLFFSMVRALSHGSIFDQ